MPIDAIASLPISPTPTLMCRVVELRTSDLFSIASRSTAWPQVAWIDAARSETWLGLGAADLLEASGDAVWGLPDLCQSRLRQISASETGGMVRYFGGMPFDPSRKAPMDWPWGDRAFFVLPEVILHHREGLSRALITLRVAPSESHEDVSARFDAIEQSLVPGILSALDRPLLMRRLADEAERPFWESAVEGALEAIADGTVSKIVLSRDLSLDADQPLDPWTVLRKVTSQSQQGFPFCFRRDAELAFVGVTPERLIARRGDHFHCDCLAGTAPPGDPTLVNDKNRREHQAVLDGIVDALAPLVEDLTVASEPTILDLPLLRHLHTPVSGRFSRGVSLAQVLQRLHPTPAVGGSPTDEAISLIARLEGRPRGWYAGPIGWVSEDSADFAVALRAGVLCNNTIRVIGGCGIVHGSDAADEWEETRRKAESFLSRFADSTP